MHIVVSCKAAAAVFIAPAVLSYPCIRVFM